MDKCGWEQLSLVIWTQQPQGAPPSPELLIWGALKPSFWLSIVTHSPLPPASCWLGHTGAKTDHNSHFRANIQGQEPMPSVLALSALAAGGIDFPPTLPASPQVSVTCSDSQALG